MAREFYPFMDPQLVKENVNPIPRCKEYDYNMDLQQFKHKDGKMYFVYDNEALKIKIWKLFMSQRFRWAIFPNVYGNELETLMGQAYTQGYVNAEAERFVREAIKRNLSDYIIKLEDFEVFFNDGTLDVKFRVVSIYGTFYISGMEVIF